MAATRHLDAKEGGGGGLTIKSKKTVITMTWWSTIVLISSFFEKICFLNLKVINLKVINLKVFWKKNWETGFTLRDILLINKKQSSIKGLYDMRMAAFKPSTLTLGKLYNVHWQMSHNLFSNAGTIYSQQNTLKSYLLCAYRLWPHQVGTDAFLAPFLIQFMVLYAFKVCV